MRRELMSSSGKKNKVVVAHPFQQHSYRTAEAIKNDGRLYAYITTVYYEKKRLIYRMLMKLLKPSNSNRLKNKRNENIDDRVVSKNDTLGILHLFLGRIDKKKVIYPLLTDYIEKKFGNKVFKFCKKNNVDAVICYDTLASQCFSKLKTEAPNVIKILDMSSTAAPFIRKILLDELNSEDEFKESIKQRLHFYTSKKCMKYQREIENTDYFLVPSLFVKQSLIHCGVDPSKIMYLPYGVETNVYNKNNYIKTKSTKLRFLYVGRVEAFKGMYYLLEAFNQMGHLDIELNIVGNVMIDKELLQKYNSNIIFHGFKSREEMPEIYQNCDIYILPSFWEGFSLTLFEAMASGLPIIASKNSGVVGVIEEYKHGFVINAGSIKDIKDKVNWFINNKDKIPYMSQNVSDLVQNYTWENYNNNLNIVIDRILSDNA